MNRRLASSLIGFGFLFGARLAFAQEVSIGYQGLPYKVTGESRTGINLGEGVLMHVGAGAEAGYDSNVFYGNDTTATGVVSSGIIRTTGFAQISNGGTGSPGVTYDARAGLTYRRYTSNETSVQPYRNAFMPSAGLSLAGNAGPWTFQLIDTFVRLEDPPYQASATNGPITRDSNLASVQAQWSPGGGRITGTLRYSNIIDIFEQSSGFSYANNLTHLLLLDVSWKWLPKTAVFFQGSQGYVTYLNGADAAAAGKVSSYPLHVLAGLRGLITPRLTAVASVGYLNGFYSSGATTSGFLGSSFVDLQAIILPTALSRVVVGYRQDFQNSVISAFYYDNAVYASYVQQVAGRLAFDLSGRLSHRRYEGLLFDPTQAPRTDNVILVGATLDYFVRNWAYAGVGYALAMNLSDYTLPNTTTEVDYTKNQVFARLGVTY